MVWHRRIHRHNNFKRFVQNGLYGTYKISKPGASFADAKFYANLCHRRKYIASLFGGVDEKTMRKWDWFYANGTSRCHQK